MSSNEWAIRKLGDIVTFQRGHDLPKTEFINGAYPIAGSNGIIGFHNKFTTKGPSITIGRSGSLGTPYYYKNDFWAHNTVLYIKEFHKSDPKFIYYLLKTIDFSKFNSGSAVPSLNRNYIHPIEVFVPVDIAIQRRIADILSALDDKIELNRQTNATLEAIAQAIFKEWFVDFNFPGSTGEMVDSELGMIPKGWRVDSILAIADLLSGGTPSTKISEFWSGKIKWVSAKDVSNAQGTFLLDTERKITQAGVENSSTKILPELTTIVTARGTVGSYCILGKPMAMNQTNYGLKAKIKESDYFVLFSLVNLVAQLKQASYGTIFDTVTTVTFEKSKIVVPPTQLIQKYNKQIEPVMEKILLNLELSATLVQIRDALLPKLMNGEIDV